MEPDSPSHSNVRRGMAMGIVILIGIAVLVMGTLMLTASGNLLVGSVDSKSRLRSRYAAEAMVAIQMARLDFLKDSLLGSNLDLSSTPLTALNTGNGEQAKAEIQKTDNNRGVEAINSGAFRGMKGVRVPFLIKSTGKAAGNASTDVQAEIYIYQVPIFQFGVFYQGNLEIMPGSDMYVGGRVHTNGKALFRVTPGKSLRVQGPVTATGSIWHWIQPSGFGAGNMYFYPSPSTPAGSPLAGLTNTISQMNSSTQPPAVNGVFNFRQGADSLNLPIGNYPPRELLTRCRGDESPSLRRQKFDCMPGVIRHYEGTGSLATYISASKVFFDRREDRWVKFRDFDVAAAQTARPNDSIFYYSNEQFIGESGSQPGRQVICAVRLVNAAHLKRNFTFVTNNPIYVMGDFNIGHATGPCKPAGSSGIVPDSLKYCNALIASDAFTVLSSEFSSRYHWDAAKADSVNMKGSLEQNAFNASWVKTRKWVCDPTPCKPIPAKDASGNQIYDGWGKPVYRYPIGGTDPGYTLKTNNTEFKSGIPGDVSYHSAPSMRINAAIMTGNKATDPVWMPPANTDNGVLENGYEGGWHNTFRFLEYWFNSTLTFRGSFICMWTAAAPGIISDPATKVAVTSSWEQLAAGNWTNLPYQEGWGYYLPPTRNWGFDTRFLDIANMPPGTPFLATGIYSNWTEATR
ncbi:MAG: hypothetical protein IPK50_02070 [Fibrobacterota bacterium]|nr:hypothetical protein [Fibrobacterota bacterium]QQS05685.1 MAG: hypothetical protein IPK50_02070 [Fibrobacterota bacterium]